MTPSNQVDNRHKVPLTPRLRQALAERAGIDKKFEDPLDDLAYAAVGALLDQPHARVVETEPGSRVAKHLGALLVDVEEAEPTITSGPVRRAARLALIALGRARALTPAEEPVDHVDFRLGGVGYVWASIPSADFLPNDKDSP
jgi:hypothetical protein